jgi:hypothetical protein
VGKVQSGRLNTRGWISWRETADQRRLAGAVEVGPYNRPGNVIAPVHLAAGKIKRRPVRTAQPTEEGYLP